ncbi:nuclear receptor coactivator 7-like [Fundulus heteroclitus]|uniref:nuclear receptor coactivator 7-like n=1 Tax=Fundulus heteroclitus TaxID=8078 RepID=UPI00165A291C|nr:nuclear receptor coactivator 7-like [Fundulus heteroclitus]
MWRAAECRIRQKIGGMRKRHEHITVLYFARTYMEPHVEIVTVKDSKRSVSLCNSVESEPESEYQETEDVLPVLKHESQLLDDYHLQKLAAHMPPKAQCYPWQLVYSTAIHGTSLRTLYRNMAGLDSPVLLVIKDMHKKVFGAFCSDPLRVSKYFYGTGETFLFSFSPDFQVGVDFIFRDVFISESVLINVVLNIQVHTFNSQT